MAGRRRKLRVRKPIIASEPAGRLNVVMAGAGLIGVTVKWQLATRRCYSVMACEGAPATTSADRGSARRGWRPYGCLDERDGRGALRPILTAMSAGLPSTTLLRPA